MSARSRSHFTEVRDMRLQAQFEKEQREYRIGRIRRRARLDPQLTLEELVEIFGTDAIYISRLLPRGDGMRRYLESCWERGKK